MAHPPVVVAGAVAGAGAVAFLVFPQLEITDLEKADAREARPMTTPERHR